MSRLEMDEHCPDTLKSLQTGFVYEDNDGLPYSCMLNLSDLKTNSNKSYIMQMYTRGDEAYFIYTRSGRVGYGGNLNVDCFLKKEEAVNEFKSIFHERTGIIWDKRFDGHPPVKGKYHFVATKFAVKDTGVSKPVVKNQLSYELTHLMSLIYDVKAYQRFAEEHRIDQKKLPLGALSKAQIDFASDILQKIKINLRSKGSKDELVDLNSQFYSAVPTSSGNRALKLIDNEDDISAKQQLLEDLHYISYLGKSQDKDVYTQYKNLATELEPVKDSKTLTEIRKYLEANYGSTHSIRFRMVNLYEVNKPEEIRRFKKHQNLHNRQLLWHGTRIENIVGILSSSFLLNPNAQITGKMFGNGIYFANSSSKSANYVHTNADGIGFMILCEVALGNPHKNVHSHHYSKAPDGFHSVLGTGRWQPDTESHVIKDDGLIIPIGKLIEKEPSNYLNYDEYIVYDTAQIRMKYLVELKIGR